MVPSAAPQALVSKAAPGYHQLPLQVGGAGRWSVRVNSRFFLQNVLDSDPYITLTWPCPVQNPAQMGSGLNGQF